MLLSHGSPEIINLNPFIRIFYAGIHLVHVGLNLCYSLLEHFRVIGVEAKGTKWYTVYLLGFLIHISYAGMIILTCSVCHRWLLSSHAAITTLIINLWVSLFFHTSFYFHGRPPSLQKGTACDGANLRIIIGISKLFERKDGTGNKKDESIIGSRLRREITQISQIYSS